MTGVENFMQKVFSAFFKSCGNLMITCCEDNIGRLESEKKSERITDLSKDEGKMWMKKLGNLKKRTDFLFKTRRSRSCFCRFLCLPFDNYNAAMLLEKWEKLDEEEPSSYGDHQLKRQSSAPVGAIEAALNLHQLNDNGIVVNGDVNYNNNNVILVLDSLSVKGESDKFPRDLVSMLRMVPEPTRTASVQSTHDNRLVRNKSFEIKNDEERRIVHSTTRQF